MSANDAPAADDATCETCEYPLAGLPAENGMVRCPECGRMNRLESHAARGPRSGRLLVAVADSFVVAITLFSFGWGWAIGVTLLLALFWIGVALARGAIATREWTR
ncbi:MAG: hypothetical protein R3B57_13290 [Phycisphaerales bacterium]